jgi:hypothetical protein
MHLYDVIFNLHLISNIHVKAFMFAGIYKKLGEWGCRKGYEDLDLWKQSVSNHLYWCAATSNGSISTLSACINCISMVFW